MDVVRCKVCSNQKATMKRCSRCHKVYYCSRECQIKDWPNHRLVCGARWKEQPGTIHGKDIWDNSDFKTDQMPSFNQTVLNEQPEITHRKDICNESDKGTANLICTSSAIVGSRNIPLPEAVQYTKQQPESLESNIEEIQHENTDAVMPPESKKRSYLYHNMVMTDVPVLDPSQSVITITVKANKQKLSISVHASWTSQQMLKVIAHRTQIPLDKLKLINKGRIVKRDELQFVIQNKAVFQAVGEQAECEDGLDARDIEVLMKQLSVERNEAIKALRKEGDVLDAILCVANK